MAPDERPAVASTSTVSWNALVADLTRRLAPLGVPAPASEARWLVEEVSGLEGHELYVDGDLPATQLALTRVEQLVARRLTGEPIQYVLGRWGFRTLDLYVDSRVLIPRPETEVVVDHALAEIDRIRAPSTDRPVRVVDLGTGSGAITLAVAVERADVEVWGTDVDSAALAVARANLAGIGRPAQRVRLVEGSWFEALPADRRGSIGVVVSNPPYIADDEVVPDSVSAWEPVRALRSGPTGLEAIETILEMSLDWLTAEGSAVVEIAPHQRDAVVSRAARLGYRSTVEPDLAGRPRVLVARRSGQPN